jgi:hypothetical protein
MFAFIFIKEFLTEKQTVEILKLKRKTESKTRRDVSLMQEFLCQKGENRAVHV